MSNTRRVLELRDEIKKKKSQIQASEIKKVSESIIEHFKKKTAGKGLFKGLMIAGYRHMGDELLLDPFFEWLKSEDAKICFPRITDFENSEMEFLEVKEKPLSSHAWVKNKYGIEEPDSQKVIDPNLINLFFVPGLAFGLSGERLGRGAGYYDRYLKKAQKALRVALCFDFQIQPAIEQGAHDQPMDWVLSERREVLNHRAKEHLKVTSA